MSTRLSFQSNIRVLDTHLLKSTVFTTTFKVQLSKSMTNMEMICNNIGYLMPDLDKLNETQYLVW